MMKHPLVVWRNLVLRGPHRRNGMREHRAAVLGVLTAEGHLVSPQAKMLLGTASWKFPCERVSVQVLRLRLADIGIDDACNYHEIRAVANKIGLDACPVEAIPSLRLQYADQPAGETLYVSIPQSNLLEGGERLPVLTGVRMTLAGVPRTHISTVDVSHVLWPDDEMLFVLRPQKGRR